RLRCIGVVLAGQPGRVPGVRRDVFRLRNRRGAVGLLGDKGLVGAAGAAAERQVPGGLVEAAEAAQQRVEGGAGGEGHVAARGGGLGGLGRDGKQGARRYTRRCRDGGFTDGRRQFAVAGGGGGLQGGGCLAVFQDFQF